MHLLSEFHKEQVKTNEEISKADPTTDTEMSIGMRIARICYFLYTRAKPFTDFEFLLLLHNLNGVKIGNINHSRKFAAKFLPFVATVIKERKIEFITSRMIQTGFRPPLALTADLATFRLKCRHFMAVITCTPDSEKLLQVITLAQPPIGPRRGKDLTDQIDDVVQEHHISPSQIPSTATDGAYHHDHVQEFLDEKWGIKEGEINHAWDAMHKSALEDGHLLKKPEFQWIVEVTATVLECFRMFRVAKKYYLLMQVFERLEMKLAHPTTLPETRMANYKYVVLQNFDKDLHPMNVRLETIQVEKCEGNSKDRQDADNAAVMRSKIYNRLFLLKLTGMCDIYNVYGHITNILQEVDKLPYEKYDKFESLIKKLGTMVDTILVSDCPKCTPSVSVSDGPGLTNETLPPITQEEANFIPEHEHTGPISPMDTSYEIDQPNEEVADFIPYDYMLNDTSYPVEDKPNEDCDDGQGSVEGNAESDEFSSDLEEGLGRE